MKLGKVRFERYKKFLKCFDKNAEELKKDSDLLMKMLGKQQKPLIVMKKEKDKPLKLSGNK